MYATNHLSNCDDNPVKFLFLKILMTRELEHSASQFYAHRTQLTVHIVPKKYTKTDDRHAQGLELRKHNLRFIDKQRIDLGDHTVRQVGEQRRTAAKLAEGGVEPFIVLPA